MNSSAFVESPIKRTDWAPFGKFGLSLQVSSSGLNTFMASNFRASCANAGVAKAIRATAIRNGFIESLLLAVQRRIDHCVEHEQARGPGREVDAKDSLIRIIR